jgi:lipid II:glycine glycyltransferase (peptidoglycan interpeptide bridge formation enzyme)
MVNARVIDSGERERWNAFVTRHPKGHFLQLWEWGQVKAATGWEPLPVVLEKDGVITAAMLILKRKLPLPLVDKCIFYSPRGPVVDIHDETLCRQLADGVAGVAREHGAVFLKIDPDVEAADDVFRRVLLQLGFRKNVTGLDFEGVQPGFVFRLDIRPSAEELLEAMHGKTRYNIRLAQRKGVTVRRSEDKADLPVFYDILRETAERDRFLIRGARYFSVIWDQMVTGGHAAVFIAQTETGQPVAGTLAMILGNKAWYLYGASSNQHRSLMPNYLIQWEMILWAKEQGCTLYDFRGVSGDLREDNPLYGLYRFKKGFSGELTEFIGDWDKVYAPLYYTLWTRALPVYRGLLRRRARSGKDRQMMDQ